MNLEEAINKIVQSPLFLRLKNIVENNGYHDHETVFDHLIKTKNIAQREITADFITDPEAKKLFLKFVSEVFFGIKRSDIIILTALLHDIGKILSFRSNDKTEPLMVKDSNGITFFPGHEYQGSKIVNEFVDGLNFPKEVIEYMSNVIKNHDTYNKAYIESKQDLEIQILISNTKSRAGEVSIEALFNIYCDCFTAVPFQKAKETIIKLFNEPKLYERREYLIP